MWPLHHMVCSSSTLLITEKLQNVLTKHCSLETHHVCSLQKDLPGLKTTSAPVESHRPNCVTSLKPATHFNCWLCSWHSKTTALFLIGIIVFAVKLHKDAACLTLASPSSMLFMFPIDLLLCFSFQEGQHRTRAAWISSLGFSQSLRNIDCLFSH